MRRRRLLRFVFPFFTGALAITGTIMLPVGMTTRHDRIQFQANAELARDRVSISELIATQESSLYAPRLNDLIHLSADAKAQVVDFYPASNIGVPAVQTSRYFIRPEILDSHRVAIAGTVFLFITAFILLLVAIIMTGGRRHYWRVNRRMRRSRPRFFRA